MGEHEPAVSIPGRGRDHECWGDGDVAGLALVGVAVGDEREHPESILEATALVAAQFLPHGAALDIDVMSGVGGGDRVRCHAIGIAQRVAADGDALVVGVDTDQLQ
jgi:hypothetical protein